MATDEPTKRKRGTPEGDPQSAKPKSGRKMVRQRCLAQDFEPTGGTPEGDSQSAKTKMGQKMALVHQRLSLIDNSSSIIRHIAAAADDDDDDNFEPMDKELAIDVVQETMAVHDDGDPHGNKVMRPQSVENEPGKSQGFRHKHKAQRNITETYKRRKTWMPADPRYAKSKLEQKPTLIHSSNGSNGKSDKDVEFTMMRRKRGRQASSKYARRNLKQKPLLVESSSGGEGKDKDGDFDTDVSDDDGQKKYLSVVGFYGTALDRALEIEKKLPAEGPSFVKLMQKSHVVKGFWMGVPVSFCRNHLPKNDVTIALEDEDGRSYDTNYLARKQGLSGGWHGFVVGKNLKVGDAVVFQLVGLTKFKVYILRENKFTTTDGALGLLSLETSMENSIPKKGEEISDEDVKSKEDPNFTRVSNKTPEDDSNELFSEEAENVDIRCIDPDPDFNAVKTFRTFKIAVDTCVIDRKLVHDRLLWTYYKLCCARKAFLHRRLLKQHIINPTLVAGVIAETVNIAEGIRSYAASSSSSYHEDLITWKNTLESFELLGMDVGFMRKRIDDLLDVRSLDDHPPEGYEEVKLERARATEKMRALQSKMMDLKDALKEMDMEMKEIAEKKRSQAMRQLAAAPW